MSLLNLILVNALHLISTFFSPANTQIALQHATCYGVDMLIRSDTALAIQSNWERYFTSWFHRAPLCKIVCPMQLCFILQNLLTPPGVFQKLSVVPLPFVDWFRLCSFYHFSLIFVLPPWVSKYVFCFFVFFEKWNMICCFIFEIDQILCAISVSVFLPDLNYKEG